MSTATMSREQRAERIAANASQWLKCHTADGRKAYGIESERTPGVYHLANKSRCSCQDFSRGHDCKHCQAVRLYCASLQQPAREPVALDAARVARLASQYDAIFGEAA